MVLCGKKVMVILRFSDMLHELLHRLPALFDDTFITELLPDSPGDYNSGVSPAEPHHVFAVLGSRGNARIAAQGALAVAHVAKPFVEETVRVGKEGTGLGKDLGISRPAETFVPLRAVGSNGKIVGTLAPEGIGNKFIDKLVSGFDCSDFELLGN